MTDQGSGAVLPGGLKPLGMTCTSTDCANGLHYFRPKPERKRRNKQSADVLGSASASAGRPAEQVMLLESFHLPPPAPRGPCRACGADLVDWDRVIRRNPADAAHTFNELKKERIRHHFWHVEIDERALRHARRKGRRGLGPAIEQRIRRAIGDDTGFDGRQTPMAGNVIYYGQHATASCCRECAEEWHAIARGRPLTEEEVAYLSKLVALYIDERLLWLKEEGETVPPLRNTSVEGNAA